MEPFPEELSESDVIAEDGCGNYFVQADLEIHFWDHETREFTVLAHFINEFIAGCVAPSEVELELGRVSRFELIQSLPRSLASTPSPNKPLFPESFSAASRLQNCRKALRYPTIRMFALRPQDNLWCQFPTTL